MCLESARTYTKPARLLRSVACMPRDQVALAGVFALTLPSQLASALKAVLKQNSGISASTGRSTAQALRARNRALSKKKNKK